MAALAALLLISPFTDATARAEETGDVLVSAVDGFIRPGYSALHQEARLMAELTGELCESPSPGAMQAAHEGFGRLVEAWSRIEIVRFGPIVEENRLERIHFFPDRRGLGLRQVQAVLVEKDETATKAATLAGKSVALQGLTALEYLLYGAGSEELATGDAFRCAFADAIADRIEVTSAELDAAWADPVGIAARLADPGPANPDYRSTAEGLQALLGVFVNSTELIADTRVAPALGDNVAAARPKLSPYWRSGLTARAFAATLDGFRDLYAASGMDRLLPAAIARFGGSAMAELEMARKAVTGLDMPFDEAVADPAKRGVATYLAIVLRSVRDTFAGRVAGGLGLSAGFSSSDGD